MDAKSVESGMSIKKAINANGLKYLLSLGKMLTANRTHNFKRKLGDENQQSCSL